MAQLKWISDSGHGWLEVPTQAVLDAGVVPSKYSYISDDRLTTYLEEDWDAAKFLQALGCPMDRVFSELYIDGDCWVRDLTHCAGWAR